MEGHIRYRKIQCVGKQMLLKDKITEKMLESNYKTDQIVLSSDKQVLVKCSKGNVPLLVITIAINWKKKKTNK